MSKPGRSVWKGSLTFGMVVIPVSLYTGTSDDHDPGFRQLDRRNGAPIKMRRFNTANGEEVPYSEVVKGYEVSKDQFVVVTEEDMAKLPLPTAKRAEVLQFTDPAKVDRLMASGKVYYVLPEKIGEQAFALLATTMRRTRLAAVVKIAIRQRERLGLLLERDGILVLSMLLWADEIRNYELPTADPSGLPEPLLKQAEGLVESMVDDFEPGKFTDEYAGALRQLVEAKVARQDLTIPETSNAPTVNLQEALSASVAAAKAATGGTTKVRQKKRTKAS